jgi:hypothetical protein
MVKSIQEPTSANSHIQQCRENIRAILTELVKNDQFDILSNLPLFLRHQQLDRMLCLNELYKKIVNVPGVIIEFGVRFGQNLALFESLRSIYEPYNLARKIVGFDTFSGFPSVSKKDGKKEIIKEGSYGVINDYRSVLETILKYHETEATLYTHIQRFELVEGDASETIKQWISANEDKIIALAYFDFDIYEPTRVCLEKIRNNLTIGSVIAFDEVNHDQFPGETIALKEVFGLNKVELRRFPNNPFMAYFVYNG